jgi:hypothetical protein
MMKKLLVLFLVIMMFGVGIVYAANTTVNITPTLSVTTLPTTVVTTEPLSFVSEKTGTIDLNEGITTTKDTTVNLNDGQVDFKLTDSPNTEVSTQINVDNVPFVPTTTEKKGNELVWKSGEKFLFIFDDPTITTSYTYTGPSLKESVVLKQDKQLSFPIKLGTNSQISTTENGDYKVISSTGNIVMMKPHAIDAAGRQVDMNYAYENNTMSLVYNKVSKNPQVSITKSGGNVPVNVAVTMQDVPITYPLTIDTTRIDGDYTSSNDITTIDVGNLAVTNVTTGNIYVNGIQRNKTVQFFPNMNVKISTDGTIVMQSNILGNPVLEIYYGYQKSSIEPWSYYYRVDTLADNPTKVTKSDYSTRTVQIAYVNPTLIRDIIASGKIPKLEDLP